MKIKYISAKDKETNYIIQETADKNETWEETLKFNSTNTAEQNYGQ